MTRSDFEPSQISYPWARHHAEAVDAVLLPWAESRKLHVLTQAGEAEARSVPVVDDAGDTYELAIGQPTETGELIVTAALDGRAGKRIGHRERSRFVATQTVSMPRLPQALEEAFTTILRWVREAGHTREGE